jgi:hypothetical protein
MSAEELQASTVAAPWLDSEIRSSTASRTSQPSDQLTVTGETFVGQGEPERRDPDRLVWSLDVRPA